MKKLIILAISTITMISLSACGKEDNTLTDDSLTEITTQATTEISTTVATEQSQGVDIVDETPKHQFEMGSWEAEMGYWQQRLISVQGLDGNELNRLKKNLESAKAQYERKSQPDESQWLFEGELEQLLSDIEMFKSRIANYQKELDPILEKIAELEAIPEDER